jgi:type I restriction enzyme S subunit
MVCVPNEKTLLKFNDIASPIFKHIVNLSKETAALTVLRDRLLPLLMNGQVEVA